METTYNKECKLGSTLDLVINTDCIWTFNGKIVTSKCDPNKGFKKENALFSDSGRYECKVDGKVLHVFNVIIYDQYDCNNGSTISLCVNEDINSLTWTLNGDEVKTECNLPNIFEKTNAGLSDSGRYECKVDGKVKYAFDVTILDSLECMVGKTTNLDYPVFPTWTFNGKNIASANETKKQFELQITDFNKGGIYACKVDGKVRNKFNVHVYDYLFQDPFIGIRTSVNGEALEKTEPHASDETTISKDIANSQIDEYPLTEKTTGIAVVVVIDNFDFLRSLPGIKKDVTKCDTAFKQLNFEVKVCDKSKAEDVVKYIAQIAADQKDDYECFVLYVSSHGGHGFVCCSDYETENLRKRKEREQENKKEENGQKDGNQAPQNGKDSNTEDAGETAKTTDETAKGFILIDTLIELFLTENCPKLKEKPKLFFFDCCRVPNEKIAKLPVSPIRDFHSYSERDSHYADILIGYGTNPGEVAYLDKTGSTYTGVLTSALIRLQKDSIADVMIQVDKEMKAKKNKKKQFSTHKSFLQRKLVLGKKTMKWQ